MRDTFWGLSGPLKNIGSLCCSVCCKRIIQWSIKAYNTRDRRSITNNGRTCDVAFSSKFFDHLLNSQFVKFSIQPCSVHTRQMPDGGAGDDPRRVSADMRDVSVPLCGASN